MNKLKRTKKVIDTEGEAKMVLLLSLFLQQIQKTNFSFKPSQNVKGRCNYWESFLKSLC